MENLEMTPEKSLKIISEAISRSRKDFEKSAGTPLIIWGAIVLAYSIAIWILRKNTGDINWNYLWFGIPVTGYPIAHILLKKEKHETNSSFIGKTLGHIWITYGIFATVLAAVFTFISPLYVGVIGCLTAVLLGFATTMTGNILKNTLITAGGFITGIGCTVALFYINESDAPLLFAIAALVDLLIPGIAMNRKVNLK